MKQTALLRFYLGALVGLAAFAAGFVAQTPLEDLMTWLAHNWPYLLIGYALTSCAALIAWISFCHIMWALDRRREDQVYRSRAAAALTKSVSRPVGNQAITSSAAAEMQHLPGEDAAEGTAPSDGASRLVPTGRH